ncbi:MAG: HepT-like ribonuclease domain-containing protein [Candidatus Helarchaeales archaeon]
MPKRGDREFIMDMLIACEKFLKYTENLSYEEFQKNELVIDAVVRNIEVLGEAAKNISEELRRKYPEIGWREISRTRDKIIHFYFGVDVSIIWDIVKIDIPRLKEKLQEVMDRESWKI